MTQLQPLLSAAAEAGREHAGDPEEGDQGADSLPDAHLLFSISSLEAQTVKNLPAMQETCFDPWMGKGPWRRPWQPTPVFLPGESMWTEEPGGLQSLGSQSQL